MARLPYVSVVTLCQIRSSFLCALLALLAVTLASGISCWHGATPHDDHPAQGFQFEHDHGAGQFDPDAPVHVAAHAASIWIAVPLPFLDRAPRPLARLLWPMSYAAVIAGIGPSTLLRPPRG
ncbi:hypothetical protein MTR62_18820 [Novosphingobium sp. 1949]|uniref:DUF2637 domain-containing protein n=1 Tax=Novosphingobium organovorum TaxID=2930092 RepID=A0ABT0BIS4_9SPHN|nr:hypothetical protein [Novosphingobium organovorum]MCJ2184726.1 hypothetical protein [Novosphingobium organovorum]